MSKYTFTIETDDLEELEVYQKAHANSYIVFEIRRNFYRKFKHLEDSDDFHRGVEKVLDELQETINEYNFEN